MMHILKLLIISNVNIKVLLGGKRNTHQGIYNEIILLKKMLNGHYKAKDLSLI